MDVAHSYEIQMEIIKNAALSGYASFLINVDTKSCGAVLGLLRGLFSSKSIRQNFENVALDGYSSFLIESINKALRIQPRVDTAYFLLH